MFNIGPMELLLILLVALIVVGPKRLPEVGRSIGRGLREIRKAQDEVKETLTFTMRDEPPARPATPRPAPATHERSDERVHEPPADPALGAGTTDATPTQAPPGEGAGTEAAPAESAPAPPEAGE